MAVFAGGGEACLGLNLGIESFQAVNGPGVGRQGENESCRRSSTAKVEPSAEAAVYR
jgi:hypothetical protein